MFCTDCKRKEKCKRICKRLEKHLKETVEVSQHDLVMDPFIIDQVLWSEENKKKMGKRPFKMHEE